MCVSPCPVLISLCLRASPRHRPTRQASFLQLIIASSTLNTTELMVCSFFLCCRAHGCHTGCKVISSSCLRGTHECWTQSCASVTPSTMATQDLVVTLSLHFQDALVCACIICSASMLVLEVNASQHVHVLCRIPRQSVSQSSVLHGHTEVAPATLHWLSTPAHEKWDRE